MQLFYRKYGDPKNKPIVVIFGLLGVSENWDFFGKRFAELGYYVLVPDVRNHGQSPHSDVFNYDVLAADIKQMIDEENIKKCYLLGHSMGGKIAMRLAFDYPDMVEKLEVLDISPRAFDHPMEHVGFISAMSRIDLSKAQLPKISFSLRQSPDEYKISQSPAFSSPPSHSPEGLMEDGENH